MYNLAYLVSIFGVIGLFIIFFLAWMLIRKIDKMKKLQMTVNKLKKALEEMDEQAKLIVRTDMELNKIQEELDKKIIGLYALQKISRAISTTLQENQIFKRIEVDYLQDLGFEKACGFLWSDKENKFIPHLNVGYLIDEIEMISSQIDLDKKLYLNLIKSEKTISSISKLPGAGLGDKINHIFMVKFFVISPILPREGNQGFFFVGTENTDVVLTEGDEELITILSNQIGQVLENARLFEKTWLAHNELEEKVEERTRQVTMALEEVKNVSKRKSDFISSVSHELRTPLTSIKGYAAILLEEKLGSLPQAVKERLAKINRHSDELVQMVNGLLDIARIESGKMTMKIEERDLKDIIDSASDLILIQCKNKDIKLASDIQKDLPRVLADRIQAERIFINLLGNAVKFTPEKGQITIRARKKDDAVQVDIQDTGVGIPPDALPRIFDEFYRVDNPINEQVKGTGLGLSLVRHIIEAHKGKIWVDSKPGKGSTFSFTLPVE
ncbi:MAG: GAF domain-containing sensor histidine kinase [Candidatus Omnitrophica bacterium]|nr:GAF domain-containing sensor histidine kinase [Candidatus Omnitrophota bacterium]